jgi:polysaccharide biosynthesis/export protein
MQTRLESRARADSARGISPRLIPSAKSCSSWKEPFRIAGKLAVFVLLLFVVGCQGTKTANLPDALGVGQTPTILVPGDTLRISFTGAPELNQTQRIPTDGKIALPLVGEVVAAGKSLANLQRDLSALYQPQLQNNEVVLALDNTATPVVVSGAVNRPGKIVLERQATVLEAVMEAGGLTPFANPKKVSLIRVVDGQHHTQLLDLTPLLRGAPTRVIYIRGGDVIYVPEKMF